MLRSLTLRQIYSTKPLTSIASNRPDRKKAKIFTDASDTACGGYITVDDSAEIQHAFCIPRVMGRQLFPRLNIPENNNNIHEAIGIYLPMRLFGEDLQNYDIEHYCDNESVVAVMSSLTGFPSNLETSVGSNKKLSIAISCIASATSHRCHECGIPSTLNWMARAQIAMADNLSRCTCPIRRASLPGSMQRLLDDADKRMAAMALFSVTSPGKVSNVAAGNQ